MGCCELLLLILGAGQALTSTKKRLKRDPDDLTTEECWRPSLSSSKSGRDFGNKFPYWWNKDTAAILGFIIDDVDDDDDGKQASYSVKRNHVRSFQKSAVLQLPVFWKRMSCHYI